MPERHRRAAGAGFRPRVNLSFLVSESGGWAVQPAAVAEPVPAEKSCHKMSAARAARFGSATLPQRKRPPNVAEIEIAATQAGADIPRALAVSDIRRRGRLVQLESAGAIA